MVLLDKYHDHLKQKSALSVGSSDYGAYKTPDVFRLSVCFIGTTIAPGKLFYVCNSLYVWKRFLFIEMGFLLPLIVVGLGLGVEYYCSSVTTVVAVL